MKQFTVYLRSSIPYKDVPFGAGRLISLVAERNVTLLLTDAEQNELRGKMPNCQFVRDNRIPAIEVADPKPAPEVKAAIIAPAGAPTTVVKEDAPVVAPVVASPSAPAPEVPATTTAGKGSAILGIADATQKIADISDPAELDLFVRGDSRARVQKAYTLRKAELSK